MRHSLKKNHKQRTVIFANWLHHGLEKIKECLLHEFNGL